MREACWQTQAAQFTPDLRLVILHGTGRAARREADLVVTTYPLLARDRDWLAAQDWPLVVLDETQTLKNPASQMAKTLREIPARGRLALTGTPLENSLQDLWTLIDWVNPGLLGDRKRFQTLFRTPIEKHGDASAQARLNRRLRPFLLRRTEEEVAAELPPRTEILDRVDLPKSQQALYETVRRAMDARVRDAIDKKGLVAARITVLDALLKLRQVCCDPGLVKTEAARSVTHFAPGLTGLRQSTSSASFSMPGPGSRGPRKPDKDHRRDRHARQIAAACLSASVNLYREGGPQKILAWCHRTRPGPRRRRDAFTGSRCSARRPTRSTPESFGQRSYFYYAGASARILGRVTGRCVATGRARR